MRANENENENENVIDLENKTKTIDLTVISTENNESKEISDNKQNMITIKEIPPVMTSKHLNNLTNSLTLIFTNNSDSILSKELLLRLTLYNTEINNWIDQTNLLLPQKSTRSKTNKDAKTTTIKDLEEVRTFLRFEFNCVFNRKLELG